MVSRVGNTTLYSYDFLRDWSLIRTYHQIKNSEMMEVIVLQRIRRSELPSPTRPSV